MLLVEGTTREADGERRKWDKLSRTVSGFMVGSCNFNQTTKMDPKTSIKGHFAPGKAEEFVLILPPAC